MVFKLIELPTKLCPLQIKNLAPFRSDHYSFTYIQTLHHPVTQKEHNQKEIIFHGPGLATEDLLRIKGNYSEGGWSLVEPGHFCGTPEY